jgi:hypothetical protein
MYIPSAEISDDVVHPRAFGENGLVGPCSINSMISRPFGTYFVTKDEIRK